MIVFKQVEMTDAILTASNVTEDDYAVWDNATDYTAGDFVISTATHTVYRCLVTYTVAGEGPQDPDAEQVALNDPLITDPDPVYWQVISATNRWKAFDTKPSVLTTNADLISYTFTPGEITDGLAAFNVSGDTFRVIVTDPTDGVVYDETIDLIDNTEVVDWYTYFFAPFSALSEVVLVDLPPYPNATIDVQIAATGGTASVGQIAFGRNKSLGFVEIGNSGFSFLDFSTVQNDIFGNLTTVEREATRISKFDVIANTFTLLSIDVILRDLKGGKPAVWVGDTDTRKAAVGYGFHRDTQTIYQEGDHAVIQIQVQGLV